MTPQEIFELHVRAGITADADAQAALYTPDGVYEAPLASPDGAFPRRLEGHDALRAGFAAIHKHAQQSDRQVDFTNSRYVLHTTTDPDVLIVELDPAYTNAAPTPLVQIYRLRNGKIALLRDYFSPEAVL